jgi:hypothetical protein
VRTWLLGLLGVSAFLALHAAFYGIGYWIGGDDAGGPFMLVPVGTGMVGMIVYLVGLMVEMALEGWRS